jgi:DNA-directed RNA polymerase subunit alpha
MKKFAKINYTEIETEKISNFETSFALKPLARGFANTMGNAIRRTLLSSVPGVAPFAVKIANVEHEFQTIQGVKEDAVQLILNLKKIKFIYNNEIFNDEQIIKISLKEKGEKTIKVSDLILPIGVEVVNKDFEIAEIAKDGKLELEIYLISGRGYQTFNENKDLIKKYSSLIESNISTGSLIAIDSDFSPVTKVSYESIELNTQTSDIQEKLKINVKTNGSVEAKDAIAQASHILISHLKIISKVSNIQKDIIFEEIKEEKKENFVEKIQISSIDLSVRSYNSLRRAGYSTIDQLSKISMDELSNIKNLGKKSVDEILDKLVEYGITIKGEE